MKTITFKKDDINLDIRFPIEENTIWMNQSDIVILFRKSKASISKYVAKVDSYINENPSVVAKNETTATNGKSYQMSYFNLDVIEMVGNMIDPVFTKEFVNWCKEQLKKERNQIMPIQSNIIRFEDEGVVLDVRVIPEQETVFLSQEEIAHLFDTTSSNISKHIKNIYESCELDEKATVKEILTVQINL